MGRVARIVLSADMRASFNPTRMQVIEKAGQKLLDRLRSFCPSCATIGFGPTRLNRGLQCSRCGLATKVMKEVVLGCVNCGLEQSRPRHDGVKLADPAEWRSSLLLISTFFGVQTKTNHITLPLNDDSVGIRVNFHYARTKLGDSSVASKIQQSLSDLQWDIRRAACIACVRLDLSRAEKKLIQLPKSDERKAAPEAAK